LTTAVAVLRIYSRYSIAIWGGPKNRTSGLKNTLCAIATHRQYFPIVGAKVLVYIVVVKATLRVKDWQFGRVVIESLIVVKNHFHGTWWQHG